MTERSAGDQVALAVRPAPQLAVELANQVERGRRLPGPNQISGFAEQLVDVPPRGLDQQLAPILPNAGSEKVEPFLNVRDLRLLSREPQTSFPKKGLYCGLNLPLQLLFRAAGDDKIIRVAHHVDPRPETPVTRVSTEGHRFQTIQG